jgi:hypothetical protein
MKNKLISITKVGEISTNHNQAMVVGKMLLLGGQLGQLTFNLTGKNYNEEVRQLAVDIQWLCDIMMEETIGLDLPPKIIADIQSHFDKTKTIEGSIGHRTNKIKLVQAGEFKSKATGIKRRKIPQEIIAKHNPKADVTIALSFGSTNFRFEVVKGKEVLEQIKIDSVLTKLTKEDTAYINTQLRTARAKKQFQKVMGLLESNQESLLGTADKEFLREVQRIRIFKTIEDLKNQFNIQEEEIIGYVFSGAGVADLDSGVIGNPRVQGMQPEIGGFPVAFYIENKYQKPAAVLNDVDSEAIHIVNEIIKTTNQLETTDTITPEDIRFLPMVDELFALSAGEKIIITGFGGGTGIGGSQIEVYRDSQDNLHSRILTGVTASAGEVGHAMMDKSLPEVKTIHKKLRESFSSQNFYRRLMFHKSNYICEHCYNVWDFEGLGSGSAGTRFANLLAVYLLDGHSFSPENIEYFKNIEEAMMPDRNTLVDLKIFADLVEKNHSMDKNWENRRSFAEFANIGDVVELYEKHQIPEAGDILQFMAKHWAAYFVHLYKLGQKVEIAGEVQDWSRFVITQGMFRNRSFIPMVMNSLRNDFEEDFAELFTFAIKFEESNQSLGAAPALLSQIEEDQRFYEGK